jgi:hypothetical protein
MDLTQLECYTTGNPRTLCFLGKHLANEAAQGTAKLTAYLLKLSHLTGRLSFDGWLNISLTDSLGTSCLSKNVPLACIAKSNDSFYRNLREVR